ncbi:MAG: hypothetical protein HY028_02340 [Gammaproteobacteria bacterium]|nr:hypothetical protein [Gammaproteobacteria bacterium]
MEKVVNSVTTGDVGSLLRTVGNVAQTIVAQKIEEKIADKIGISPTLLNAGLTGLSIIGNEVAGSRYTDNFQGTGQPGFNGVGNRGPIGAPFDAVDIVLGYQGLPTASTGDYINGSSYATSPTGYSGGVFDANYLVSTGNAVGGNTFAPPFGTVAPGGVNPTIGAYDLVNGGVLGVIPNPTAIINYKPCTAVHFFDGCYGN